LDEEELLDEELVDVLVDEVEVEDGVLLEVDELVLVELDELLDDELLEEDVLDEVDDEDEDELDDDELLLEVLELDELVELVVVVVEGNAPQVHSPGSPAGMQRPGQRKSPLVAEASHCSYMSSVPSPHVPWQHMPWFAMSELMKSPR